MFPGFGMILEVWLRHHKHLTIATRGFSILGDPGADSGGGGGGEGKSNGRKLITRRKLKNGEKSPFGSNGIA